MRSEFRKENPQKVNLSINPHAQPLEIHVVCMCVVDRSRDSYIIESGPATKTIAAPWLYSDNGFPFCNIQGQPFPPDPAQILIQFRVRRQRYCTWCASVRGRCLPRPGDRQRALWWAIYPGWPGPLKPGDGAGSLAPGHVFPGILGLKWRQVLGPGGHDVGYGDCTCRHGSLEAGVWECGGSW